MNCWLFFHKYKLKDKKTVQQFDSDKDFPVSVYTNFLYKCEKCNKLCVKKLDGDWTKYNDDDDDRDPPTPPILSPDDFYASLGSDK